MSGRSSVQPGHLLVARRQRPDGDQDAAQVLDGLAGRQFVEDLVSELSGGVQAVQDGRGCALVRARRRRCLAGPLWRGHGRGPAARADLPVSSPSRSRSRRFTVQRRIAAGVEMRPVCPQSGQLRQKPGSGRGAGRAERLAGGTAADRSGLHRSGAPDPALLAGAAPWLAGGFGDHARGVVPADPAGQDLPWHAVHAERPARCPDVDRTAAATAGAGLLVGRIGDQAMGA